MRANQIIVGEAYAYQPEGWGVSRDEFLRAVVTAAPQSGTVAVHVEHPDEHVPDWDARVPTRLLAGGWDAEPAPNAPHSTDYQPTPAGVYVPLTDRRHLTYAEHSAGRYRATVLQRERAARLTALGIERTPRHYAGHGGTDHSYFDGGPDVTRFDEDEVDRLLQLAEEAAMTPDEIEHHARTGRHS